MSVLAGKVSELIQDKPELQSRRSGLLVFQTGMPHLGTKNSDSPDWISSAAIISPWPL